MKKNLNTVSQNAERRCEHNPNRIARLFASLTIAFALSVGCLISAGCSTTASRTLSSQAEFNKLYAACKEAAIATGFGITSANAQEGFIAAQRGLGFGDACLMNIQLSRSGQASTVQVSIVPPEGTIGSLKKYIDAFAKQLKARVPDVAVAGV